MSRGTEFTAEIAETAEKDGDRGTTNGRHEEMALTPPAPSARLPALSPGAPGTMRFPWGRRPVRLGGWEWGPGEAAARVQASETP